jgi:hypothetical protein
MWGRPRAKIMGSSEKRRERVHGVAGDPFGRMVTALRLHHAWMTLQQDLLLRADLRHPFESQAAPVFICTMRSFI